MIRKRNEGAFVTSELPSGYPAGQVLLEKQLQTTKRDEVGFLTRVDPLAHRQYSPCVLVVDDDQVILHLNSSILRKKGYEVVVCRDAPAAVAIVKAREIDLAILDFQMHTTNGAELAALCKAEHPEMKVVLFSGHLGMTKPELAFVDLFIAKSEGVLALLEAVKNLLPRSQPLDKHATHSENGRPILPD